MDFNNDVISDFLNKYDYWLAVSKKEVIEDSIVDRNSKLTKFLDLYPESSITSMPIEKYVVGRRENTFCRWVETELCDLGDIRGGQLTAYQRFGVYYDSKKQDYSFGSKVTKKTRFGSNVDVIYKNVRAEIVSLIADAKTKNFKGIASNKLNPLFKNKITFLYDSKNRLPIFSDADLNILLSVLEIPFSKSSDRVFKREALFRFFKALNRSDITTLSFMDFIYNNLGYRRYLRSKDYTCLNSNVEKKEYRLVKVNSVKEILSNSNKAKHGLAVIESHETLVQKKLIGKIGEDIVKNYLMWHKEELDIDGEIECACEVDDFKHYDFSFKKKDGTIIYIEVKSTKTNINNKFVFDMSNGEYDFMMANKDNYFVYFINDVFNGNVIKSISAKLIIGKPIKYKVSLIES